MSTIDTSKRAGKYVKVGLGALGVSFILLLLGGVYDAYVQTGKGVAAEYESIIGVLNSLGVGVGLLGGVLAALGMLLLVFDLLETKKDKQE